MIFILIWRNLWRNKRRSLITMASVTFAVLLAVSMKSLQKGVFDNLVKNIVSFYSGYIQVHKNGYTDEQVLDNSFDLSDSLINTIEKTENISAVSPRIESFALASSDNKTHGCMLVGIQPDKENKLTGLQSKIIEGKYFSDTDSSILVAEGLAKKLSITLNDTLVLLGQGYHGSMAAGKYCVKAIAHFGSPALNESLVFLTLKTAQNFLSVENKITTLALSIKEPLSLEATGRQVEKTAGSEFEVRTWKQMVPDIEAHIEADNQNFYIFIGVLYLLIAFGIFGTLLMMLTERRYETGMLMAIGMNKLQVGGMLVLETILLSMIGAIGGIIISIPVVKYFQWNPIKIGGKMAEAYKSFGFEALWPAAWDINIFMTQALIVLCLALVISIYPLVKVQRMEAVANIKR